MRDFTILNYRAIAYITVFILFLPLTFLSASEDGNPENCDRIYTYSDSVKNLPDHERGYSEFMRFNNWAAKPAPIMNGYYPGKAQVILKFGVDKKGKAFNPQILKIQRTYYDYERDKYFHEHYREYWEQGIDYDYCKEEALRILSMARFVPAHKDGVAVCFEPIITIIYTYYAAPGYD